MIFQISVKQFILYSFFLLVITTPFSAAAQDFFTVLCYHDVVDKPEDMDDDAILVSKLASQFQWLKENGYIVISIQDLLDVRDGKKNLPEKAVLLTFDDGYKSFYERVFPLLKAFNYPALSAICGIWIDTEGKEGLYHTNSKIKREEFMTWAQIKEVYDSGLVEIASHTYNLHHGIPANPQGTLQPAAVTLERDPKTGQYETIQHFENRIRADLKKNSDRIAQHIGKAPRAIVWPYGRYGQFTQQAARELGMPLNFLLTDDIKNSIHNLSKISRAYYNRNGELADFVAMLERWDKEQIRANRSLRVTLDSVYDPNPDQFEKKLSDLIERVSQFKINTVFLQGFSTEQSSGLATQLYFPNRHLPVKGDIMNRVAWQLRSRGGVNVYAWMPILGFDLNTQDRQKIREIYEDLVLHVPIDGIAFYDDTELRQQPDCQIESLTHFTKELEQVIKRYREDVKTTRSLFTRSVFDPTQAKCFSQKLDHYIRNYTFVCLMAMPYQANAEEPAEWIDNLFQKVKEHPKGLKNTLFELQSIDWKDKNSQLDPDDLKEQMRTFQQNGAIHFGYYPDDFANNIPDLKIVKEGISLSKVLSPKTAEELLQR